LKHGVFYLCSYVASSARLARTSLLDFPAYDNAERHGWDGQVKTDTVTPWIPAGLSGWEFGCDKDPRAKAQKDYMARVANIPKEEREKAVDIALAWPEHNESTLGDLIEEMHSFEKKDQDTIWRLVKTWVGQLRTKSRVPAYVSECVNLPSRDGV
jgi:hypothetical protein